MALTPISEIALLTTFVSLTTGKLARDGEMPSGFAPKVLLRFTGKGSTSRFLAVGGLAGGGKGALIGTAAGAGAGTGVAAATGKEEAVIHAESALTFTTITTATVK